LVPPAYRLFSFCKTNPVNKTRLLQDGRMGFGVALAAAITAHPAEGDDKLSLNIDPTAVPRGFAQHVAVDALLAVDTKRAFGADERMRAVNWVNRLPDPKHSLGPKITKLKRLRTS
jgi:hypothetical protein